MPTPRTLASVKNANRTFFSKKSVEFHGDKEYKIVGDVLEVRCKYSFEKTIRTVRYQIGKNNKLIYILD